MPHHSVLSPLPSDHHLVMTKRRAFTPLRPESSLPSLVHMLTMPNRWSGPKRPMALTCFGLVSPPRCESTAVHCWPEHMRARLKITISRLESPQGHHRTSSSQASSRAEASPRCTGSRAVTVPIPLPETDPGAGKGVKWRTRVRHRLSALGGVIM